MADVTITVAEHPKEPTQGKKKGIVIDTTGKYWYVWPDKLWSFTAGNSYRITEYETSEFKGRTYYTIKSFQQLTHGANGTAPSAPPIYRVPEREVGVSDNVRRMDIFICGAFNNLMANPNVNPTEMHMMDMIDALHKFKGAWMGVFGPSPLPQRTAQTAAGGSQYQGDNLRTGMAGTTNSDMNDDIPF